MNTRTLTPAEKRIVLDRDGWCCNRCGYVPFHTFRDVPTWAKTSYQLTCEFTRGIESRPPVVFVNWKLLPDTPDGGINLKLDWLHGGELEFDHIIPITKGGSLSLDNTQAICHNCHRIKTNMELRYTNHTKYSIHKFVGELLLYP